MIQTLPLVLFIVMTELSIGAFTVLVLLDWRHEVTRGFLVSYGLIYLVLTGLTYLFQQGSSTPELLNTFQRLDKAWTGYETLPLLLFLLLMIPYNILLWLDKHAGVAGKKPYGGDSQPKESKEEPEQGLSAVRLLRLVVGGLAMLAGLVTLLVMAMIYRTLASTTLGEVFTVASFFAGALVLGGVMTAMWLGHWYLAAAELSGRPLQFATTLVLLGILLQIIFTVVAGPSISYANSASSGPTATATATPADTVSAATPAPKSQIKPVSTPTYTPLSIDVIGWLRILVSFVMPLIFGGLAWKLIRDHSFQSATGMLYLVVVCTLAGEAIARGLFLMGL